MLESVVSTILNRVLGAYVSNLNYNQLRIGIWSGEVVLRNLKLKREALDKLDLPVDVLEGYLGELILTIPWSNLRNLPMRVSIKDLYVLAVPRNDSAVPEEDVEEREYEAKMRKLHNAEMIQPTQSLDAVEEAKSETFVNQLITKILNNIQFSITNIHVRYEDNVATHNHRFAVGITLSELSALSTDENWEPQPIGDAVDTVHKLATLESLSVYWNTDTHSLADDDDESIKSSFKSMIATKNDVPKDHQYILKPVSGTGRIKLNKRFGDRIPKVDATMLFDELAFVINDEQYRDAVLLADLFHSAIKRQKYRHLHPPPDMTPKTNPREYFQFAAEAVLSEIHDRNKRWTWESIRERRDDRLEYIDCYVAEQLEKATPEQVEKLRALEHKLSFEDIRFYRNRAKKQLVRERADLEKRRKEEASAAARTVDGQPSQGWISSWWYGTSAAPGNSEQENDLVITEEQKQEFFDAIEYDDDAAAVSTAAIDFPSETMFLKLNITLNRGSFAIQKYPQSDLSKELLSLRFDTVVLGFIKYVQGITLSAALGDLQLYDGLTKDTRYRRLISAKQKDTSSESEVLAENDLLEHSDLKNPLFSVIVEHKPIDGRADNAAALVMRNVDIIYNPAVIRAMVDFFKPPETSADSIQALIDAAGDTFQDIKNQTRASLEFVLDQRTTFDLKVDMDAPVIVIPEESSECRGIVIDAGHINVESNLASPDAVQTTKDKTTIDKDELRSLMYDRFTIHLTRTKVLIGDSTTQCLEQVRKPRSELNYLHFFDEIDLKFMLDICILNNTTDLSKIIVSGHLPLLAVNFSDTKYRMILQIPKLIEACGLFDDQEEEDETFVDAVDMNSDNNIQLQQPRNASNIDHANGTNNGNDTYSMQSSSSRSNQPKSIRVIHKDSTFDQTIVEFRFKIDTVSARVAEASKGGESAQETVLCDLELRHLALNVRQRQFDRTVHVLLKSLCVTDRMQHGDEFRYLITSNQLVDQVRYEEVSDKYLVNVEYDFHNRANPNFENCGGMDHNVKVTLSTLNFVITRSSVLCLNNFILHTFVDDEIAYSSSPRRMSLPGIRSAPTSPQKPSNIEVKLHMESVNFVFNNDGTRLATGKLSKGDMSMSLISERTRITAKFANFTLSNDLDSKHDKYSQLLTIRGDELIDLRYDSHPPAGATTDSSSRREYDQSLFIRMGSAEFTFLEEPVSMILDYLSKFAAMKIMYDHARQAAMQSAQQLQQVESRIHFDIIIRTPVVLFPESQLHPDDVVVAHLGEIWASNSFQEIDQHNWANVIKAGLRAISLKSHYHVGDERHVKEKSLSMIDDTDVTFDIVLQHDSANGEKPGIDVQGSVKDISMRLAKQQYTFLLDIIQTISKVISSNHNADSSLSSSPNNSGVVTSENNQVLDTNLENPDHLAISFTFAVQTVCLEVLMEQDQDEKASLSRIALNNVDLMGQVLNDGRISSTLYVRSLTVNDTRPNIKSKFTEIVPAIEDIRQFELQLDLSTPYPKRHGIALITIQYPKVILSLDHAFLLVDFFTAPFVRVSESTSNQSVSTIDQPVHVEDINLTNVRNSNDDSTIDISYRINISNAEFILLANPDQEDSEAVVLSADELMLSQQAVTALAVKQVGMYLCRMARRSTTTLRFIQSFDASMSMNSSPMNDEHSGQRVELEVDVDALIFRLSYRDVILITTILNKAFDLYTSSTGNKTTFPGTSYAQNLLGQDLTPDTTIRPKSVNESLRGVFRGVQIILIEEIHEMPMMDLVLEPFKVEVSDWSQSLQANIGFSTHVNYFNIKNSHWEPLVEPWKFTIDMARPQAQALGVTIGSSSDLNVNITHTFLEGALNTLRLLDKREELLYSGERGAVAPYLLRNRTGYRLHVWNTMEGQTNGKDVVIRDLDDGKKTEWWFDDWRKRRETTTTTNNLINAQLEGALWETLRNVSVDVEGEHIYELRPPIQGIVHRAMFHVQLMDNVKVVDIQSTVKIENKTLLSIEVVILDAKGSPVGRIHKIDPGDDYPIPIEQAYHNRFCVRPDAGFGYTWADRILSWRDFMDRHRRPATIKCKAYEDNIPPFIFQFHSIIDKKTTSYHYPIMSIRISAPVEIENLLPYDFKFRIIDKTAGQDYSSFLRRGGTTPLHVIGCGHFLLMNIDMPDTGKYYGVSEYAIISTRGTEDLDVEDTFQFNDAHGVRLTLRIHQAEIPDSGGARKFTIYCPYVIINKTGLPITFKAKPAFSMWSSNQTVSVCRPGKEVGPFMYSYPKTDNKNRSLIQVADSGWSQPLSFEAVGSVYDIELPCPAKSEVIHVGISIQEGLGKLTKIVTFTPRFILSNQMEESIRYREPESRHDHILASKNRTSLFHLRDNDDRQLSIKLPGINYAWSAPFNIQDIGKVHVRLNSADGYTKILMRVTTHLEGATVFIILSKESNDGWPYRIVNQTNEDMTIYQEDPILLRDDTTIAPMRNQRVRRYKVPEHHAIPYAWDIPATKEKKLILRVNGRERSINPQEIGSQLPFRHASYDGRTAITAIDIKTSGTCQIVQMTPYSAVDSYYKPLPSPSSSTRSNSSMSKSATHSSVSSHAAKDGFEAANMETVVHCVFRLKFSQIGMSLISKELKEIAYITLRGLDVKLTDSNMYQSLRWQIQWVQIDNQMDGSTFPILLYPTTVTKESSNAAASSSTGSNPSGGNQEMLPTFRLALDRVKDNLLLLEMSIEMDEDFIYSILDFSRIGQQENEDIQAGTMWNVDMGVPDITSQDETTLLYFEMLSIQPVQIDLSFLRTNQPSDVDESYGGSSTLMFFTNILTMAIGNINAAPVRFNALLMENLRASGPDLGHRIFLHYSDQFLYQIHRILGSADFLGNPVGLFNNLSSGVAELFYEPWQGFIISDRPQDLGLGIARGFSGFLRKSVFGVTDSFTKFTGSIGKGLSAATMDREYQDRRRINMARNRPRHALGGVAQGANSFANSVASGVAGLVTRPMEGAAKEGVGGFLTGFGKGLVGAVTKPVVGVFDLASNVTEGIRNTTTQDTNEIERVRYPRFIASDGILRPYSGREAQGQYWLREVDTGKYRSDQYKAYCPVYGNERMAMLTSHRLMLIKTWPLITEWQEPFTEIQTIKCQPTGIHIYLRSGNERFLIITDEKQRTWFLKRIEEAVTRYNQQTTAQTDDSTSSPWYI